jgi:tRNA dimethylallyltransferase
MRRIAVITGPTASGKSKLALEMALKFNGSIINADSVQIYEGADIGSAKPSPSEMATVPHLLYSKLTPDKKIDAARFADLSNVAIKSVIDEGRLPIVTGGTGLYLKSLLHGMVDLPKAVGSMPSFEIRVNATPQHLYELLREIDPESADRISPNDQVRIRRALEIYQQTGSLPSALRREHSFATPKYSAFVVVCIPERDVLYEAINQRTRGIVAGGLIDETRRLVEKYGGDLHVLKAIGYKEAVRHLAGEIDIDAMSDEIAKRTRNLAKRQFTWWKNEPTKLGWSILGEIAKSTELLFAELSNFVTEVDALAEDRIYVRFFAPDYKLI